MRQVVAVERLQQFLRVRADCRPINNARKILMFQLLVCVNVEAQQTVEGGQGKRWDGFVALAVQRRNGKGQVHGRQQVGKKHHFKGEYRPSPNGYGIGCLKQYTRL